MIAVKAPTVRGISVKRMPPSARPKPLLRGVSHEIAFVVATAGAIALVASAHGARATTAAAVYGASLAAMFGISTLYHRPTWGPTARRFMRRLDHATIYLFIAGTYTPVCLLALPHPWAVALLWVAWGGAALGIVQSILWVQAPRLVSAAGYVALGWAVTIALPKLSAALGVSGLSLLLGGGLLYVAGAVIYALRRPDPAPKVFGYHEIFHALVIAASACHFVLERRLLLAP